MKSIVIALAVLVLSAPAWAQDYEPTAPPSADVALGTPPSALLPALIEHSRRTMRIEDGRLVGDGAAFLSALGEQSHFVLIGEEHGNEGIADFARAYWNDLNALGYNYGAIEVDPWTAEAFAREYRGGGMQAWTRFAQQRGGALAAPFLTWAPEAQLAAAIVATSQARREPALWGLDQVFLGSAWWILNDIAENARDRAARSMAAALAASGRGSLEWFADVDERALLELRAELSSRRDARYAEMVDAMIASRRIYQPFTNNTGESWRANHERETLMKLNFLARYRAAERADGEPPRVMLKFGGYHMYRGPTPTHVMGLGGFVTEFATMNGQNALSIYAGCGPGGFAGNFSGAESCDTAYQGDYAFLAPYLSPDEITVFDLRVWKLRPRRWAHLPGDVRNLIASFDVLVIVPNGGASQFLPGLSAPASASHEP